MCDEPLNNYLKRHAWANQSKSSIGITYVAIDDAAPAETSLSETSPSIVLGNFTQAMASVPRDQFPKKQKPTATANTAPNRQALGLCESMRLRHYAPAHQQNLAWHRDVLFLKS